MKAWNSFVLGVGYVFLASALVGVVGGVFATWETIQWRRTIAKAQRKAFLKQMERAEEVASLDHLYRVK